MEQINSSYEEKFQRFSNIISTKTMQGYMVADRNDRALIAVLVKAGGKVNHLLHFFNFLYFLWILDFSFDIFNFSKIKRKKN